jgi:inosine-uridine nucleoside N-ribohydrolase
LDTGQLPNAGHNDPPRRLWEVVAGNVPLEQAVQNALYTREIAESEVPVYAGRPRPRDGLLRTAQFVHGEDGMGDVGLDLSGRTADEGDAVDVLIDRIRARPGELTIGEPAAGRCCACS